MRTRAAVDIEAIASNVRHVRTGLAGSTRVCAVVKANGYGHGAALAARGALEGGADWLAVATAAEATQLRDQGFREPRVLVMGTLDREDLACALAADADIVAWSSELLDALPEGSPRAHVKLDTGMGRLGVRDAAHATALAQAGAARGVLAGLMTHFATADVRGDRFFDEQLVRFADWAAPLRGRWPGTIVHAANSAAMLRDPRSHFDMVRPGTAIYGMDPFGEDPAPRGLRPVLRLSSRVMVVKRCARDESAGYGRRFVARHDTTIGVIPIGFADGWRRALGDNSQVTINGRRFPLVGTVSMDNVSVDLGPDGGGVAVGDEAVLIGDGISIEQVAARIGTINTEIACAISPRVPRIAVTS